MASCSSARFFRAYCYPDVSYVLIRCYINPKLGPALPLEERVDWREKLRLLKNTIAPILLIVLVLGVIFVGIATPVEAAGIGPSAHCLSRHCIDV